MSCKDCVYATEVRQGHEISKNLVCRRFPPTGHLVPQAGGVGIMAINPPVAPDGWCGEFATSLDELEDLEMLGVQKIQLS